MREGASSITIVYPMLTDGVRFFDITVTVEIRCLPSSRLEFSIDVQNRSSSRIDECRFPASTVCSTAKATRTIRSSIRTMPG